MSFPSQLSLWTLALSTLGAALTCGLVGCASTAPEGAPAPESQPRAEAEIAAGAASASPEDERLRQLSAELSLRDQERSALAQHYFETGQAHFTRLEYREASRCFAQAHQADPNDREILEAKLRTEFILGDRQAEIASVAQAFQQRTHRRIDQERAEVRRLFQEGEELFRAGRYRQAELRFERVLERLKWFPYDLDTGLEERARRGLVEAKRGRRIGRRQEAEARQTRALAAAERERRSDEAASRARLDLLVLRAREELRVGRPRRAEATLRDLAALAPRHPDLGPLRARARALRHRQAERGTAARNRRNQRVDRIANREAAVPTFPGD